MYSLGTSILIPKNLSVKFTRIKVYILKAYTQQSWYGSKLIHNVFYTKHFFICREVYEQHLLFTTKLTHKEVYITKLIPGVK
jgi:hypothetical protein